MARRSLLVFRMSRRGVATLAQVDPGDVEISFGQHQGQPLKSLPQGYLKVLARFGRSEWGTLAEEVLRDRRRAEGILERDIQAQNQVLQADAVSGHFEMVKALAEKLPVWNLETVKILLSVCVETFDVVQAQLLLEKFPDHNDECLTIAMAGFARFGNSQAAQELFDRLLHRDEEAWTALVTAYARDGRPHDAKSSFDSVPSKSELSWAVLVEEYARNLQLEEAEVTLDKAPKWSVRCWTAMIVAYAATGHEQMARIVFHKWSGGDAGVWNAFIAGLTLLGRAGEATRLLKGMSLEGFSPDGYTFVNLVSACSVDGLAEKGGSLLREMVSDYSISPWKEHFDGMAELLGRAGHLDRAQSLIKGMPFEPDFSTWKALFHACRHHRDLRFSLRIARELIRFDPNSVLPYALLAESLAAAGKPDKVAVIGRLMEKSGVVRDNRVASWVLVDNRFQKFVPGDAGQEIRARLEEMIDKIVQAGYKKIIWKNKDEGQNSHVDHPEMIALAFGLINNTRSRCSIRIINSSRVCYDCHNAFKFVSQVTSRIIVLRDDSRIHLFDRGHCSCRDFW